MELSRFFEYMGEKARSILSTVLSSEVKVAGRPVTEYDLIRDYLKSKTMLVLAQRTVEIPGYSRWLDLIIAAIASFKKMKQRLVVPPMMAGDDDITAMPIRPQDLGMSEFKITTPDTVPAVVDLIPPQSGSKVTVDSDKEMYIFTDFAILSPNAIALPEIQFIIDGKAYRPLVCREVFGLSNLYICELEFPLIADSSIDINARAEQPSQEVWYLPIGVHIGFGSVFKGLE